MRTLIGEGVPNITQPTAEYPFGKYKDKTSSNSNDGTELSERTLGDCYQGMLNTITGAGMIPNNEPERKGGSQFQDAVELLKPVGVAVVGSDDGGTTFKVLGSIIRDPEITFQAGFKANSTDINILSANFQIQRNGVVDDTHRYIVTASRAYNFSPLNAFDVYFTPQVFVAHSPYFNNMSIYISDLSNLFFLYADNVTPTQAVNFARAVLTVYDAGPVA